MIVGSQLWMFALPSSDQSDSSLIFPPSFFDLSPANGSSLRFVDATSFSITIHEEVETFRARTVAEAKRWMLTLAGYFHRRMSAISPQFHAHGSKAAEDHSENMCFATLEQQIGDAAKRQAINRFQIVEQYYQFNGAMRQNSLRDSFRAHLRKINQHHLLLFWEYCEDYRRSHFSRSAPAAYSCDKYLLDESVSSSYYQAIRLAFLDASSPFFVSFSAEQSPDHLTSSSTVLCNAQHTALARLKDIFRSYSTSLVFKRKCQALHQVFVCSLPSLQPLMFACLL